MVFPKEYEQNLIQEAAKQATDTDTSNFVEEQIKAPQTEEQAKIYLPEDPELRNKILDARDDLKVLRDYSIKNNLNAFQTDQLVDELLGEYGLTKEQVAGVYQRNSENLYKSFTNGFNKRLSELLQAGTGFLPYINWTASDIDEYLAQEEDYRNNLKTTIADAFEKANFVDERFTPKTLGERIADRVAAGTLLGIEFAAGGATLTAPKVAGAVPAGANILKQMGPNNFKNNVYDTGKKVIDEIIQVYRRSPTTAALTDILATTGWELGELPADLSDKKIEDLTTSEAVWRGVAPFVSSLALPGFLYGFPVATYNAIKNIGDEGLANAFGSAFKNVFDKKAEAKGVAVAKDEIQKSVETDYAKQNLNKAEKIEDLVAPVIESQNAKRAEKDKLKFELSLAERTQDPQLLKTQQAMESTLPVRSEILTNRQERTLKNKAVLDAVVEAEFPNSIPKTIVKNDGTVDQVYEPIKKFNQYVDPQKNINKAIADDVPTKIAEAEESLIKTFPKIPDEVLKDAGIYLRGNLGNTAKKTQDDLYQNLESIVREYNPRIEVNTFVDDVRTELAVKPFQTTGDLPMEYTVLKDLTKPFEEVINKFNVLFEQGLATGVELDEAIQILNQRLLRNKRKGDAPFGLAPQYDTATESFTLSADEVVGLKKSLGASLNKALRNPDTNSEKIRRLSLLQDKTDDLLKQNPDAVAEIDNWLATYNKEYIDKFEKGVILKLRREDGGGDYKLPNERVGAAFLESPETLDQFKTFFGDNPIAIEGINNAFYDTMIKNVFTPQGTIDQTKLNKFKSDNLSIINKMDEIMPNFTKELDNKFDLGSNLANRINELNARLNIGGKIELDQLAKDTSFGGITYKNAEDMVNKAIKDPDEMETIVKAIAKADPDGIMMQAFKNEIFKKWSAPIRAQLRKGEYPDYKKMSAFLDTNEDSFRRFFELNNDFEGFDRLRLITEAYEVVGAVPFPVGSVNANEFLDGIKSIIGTDYPQIMSRIFAVQSGRTGIKFVAGEILARMFRQIGIRKRNEVLAEALYNREFSDSLLKMIVGQEIKARDLDNVVGFLGRIGGMVTNGMDELVEDAEIDSFKERVEQERERTTPGDQSQAVIPPQPVLNSPTISPASSLNQVSMAFLPPVGGNRGQLASRGQQVFGATDTVFG